ncbi:MAG: response regulator [Desulfoprunum sp.]|nr:response regulator [Desulfoprunum sp.]
MKKIVVADDSTTARMFVIRCLEIIGLNGAEFLPAANGREALELLKKNGADLLVTDLNMPEMDGATLLKKVKASPGLHEIPVVVVSSGSNPAKNEELKKLGALAVLEKPVSPAALLDVLGALIHPKEKSNDGSVW